MSKTKVVFRYVLLCILSQKFYLGESGKVEERVQSVLVSAGTSNGPMLSHSPPHYNKQTDCSESVNDQFKDDFLRNGGKVCLHLAWSSKHSFMHVWIYIPVLLAVGADVFYFVFLYRSM